MRRAFSLLLIPALILVMRGIGHARVAPMSSTLLCRGEDGFATDLRSYVIDVAAGTDSLSMETRAAWNIPAISDSTQIVFVSDSTKCARAAVAHAVAEHVDSLNPPPVYLLGVGTTRYITFNGARAGEFLVHYVLDQNFNVLESF